MLVHKQPATTCGPQNPCHIGSSPNQPPPPSVILTAAADAAKVPPNPSAFY